MSVRFSIADDTFRPQLPQALFDYPDSYSLFLQFSRDGSRMLTTKEIEDDRAAPRNPTVVVNWFDELEAKVPVAR
jgi:hypothetical protein